MAVRSPVRSPIRGSARPAIWPQNAVAPYVGPLDDPRVPVATWGWSSDWRLTADHSGDLLSVSDAVDTIYDQIGTKDLTQTSTARPSYSATGLGGQPTIDFDGTNDYLNFDALGGHLGGFFMVFQSDVAITKTSTAAVPFSAGNNFGVGFGAFTGILTDEIVTLALGSTDRAGWLGNGSIAADTPHILTVRKVGTRYEIRIDGVIVDIVTSGVLASMALSGAGIVGAYASAASKFNGKISTMIVWPLTDLLTEAGLIVLLKAAALRYGISVELQMSGAWTWWNQPPVRYYNGAYYLSSMQEGGVVPAYRWEDDDLDAFALERGFEFDDHDNASPLVLPDSRLLFGYSKHTTNEGARFRVSTAAESVAAFGDAVGLADFQTLPVSYFSPLNLPISNQVLVFHRAGVAGSLWRWRILRSAADDLATWTEVDFAWTSGQRNYPHWINNGNNRIDIVTTNGHPGETATSVYHLYILSDASGNLTYHQSDGTEITAAKPFDIAANATLIYDGTTEDGWNWDIRIGADGHPRVLFTKFVSTTDHRYMFSRWTGSAWTTPTQIVAGGKYLYAAQPHYSGGMSFDGANKNIVYASVEVSADVWEIQEFTTADDGATWVKTRDLTAEGSSTYKRCRPFSPEGHDGTLAVAWWRCIYIAYNNYHGSRIDHAAAA